MTENSIKSYQDLIVWKKAVDLVIAVYGFTSEFPKTEIYGLSSQMRRASVSIPSNIAEGRRRSTRKDYRNFLLKSFGSGSELETQIVIAKRLGYCNPENYEKADLLLDEVMRMLNKSIITLEPNS